MKPDTKPLRVRVRLFLAVLVLLNPWDSGQGASGPLRKRHGSIDVSVTAKSFPYVVSP